MENDNAPDFYVRNEGTIFLFTCNTPAAREWWDENVQCDNYCGSMGVVEHRYASALIEYITEAGFTIEPVQNV